MSHPLVEGTVGRKSVSAVILDFGGVIVGGLRESFLDFCATERVDPPHLGKVLREAWGPAMEEHPLHLFEIGAMAESEFCELLAARLSEGAESQIDPVGLPARMMSGVWVDEPLVEAVRRLRRSGMKLAMLSNSWGDHDYPDELQNLFDVVVVSGRVGLRKPQPEIFLLTCEQLGFPPERCVFVDDFRANIEAAESLGMMALLHRETDETIHSLESLCGIQLVPNRKRP